MRLTRRGATRLTLSLAAAGLAAWLAPAQAAAQGYPSKPIRILVPTPPGGLADILARTAAQKIGENTKVTIVVENRTGASGVIAAEAAARAPADGYTVFLGYHPTQAILPHLLAKLPYDAEKDFAPVILIAHVPNILVVHPSLEAKSIQELIAYAKANPGKLSYASQGNGTSGHVAGELFKQLTGTDIAHVPYRGAAPATADLLAGQVQMMFDIVPLAMAHVRAGKMRALAIAGDNRVAPLPDVPSTKELGFGEIQGGAWFGFVVPTGTPPEAVAWLNTETKKAFSAADVRDNLTGRGAALPLGTPEEFGTFIAAERTRWGEVIRRGNIKIE